MSNQASPITGDFDVLVQPPGWKPALLSLVLHAALFAAIVYFWRSSEQGPAGETTRAVELVLAEETPFAATEYFDQQALATVAESTADVASVLPSTLPPSVAESALAALEDAALPSVARDASAMAQSTAASPGAIGSAGGRGQLSAAELEAIAEEQARLAAALPKGEPATLRVFGSGGLTGRKFVFVLDRSNSMGSGGLGVLDLAAVELQRAVEQLGDVHQFQVVAYHHATEMIEARTLLPADAAHKAQVKEFVYGLAAFGATEHEIGLIAALSLKPDVVVLMSDGGLPELNDYQLDTIRRLTGKKTQIHCIQFGAGPLQSSAPFMQALASQNNGTFRYIDVNELDH